MSEWISVKDWLPESGDWYLIAATTEALGGCERVTTMAFLDADIDDDGPIWLAHNDTESDDWQGVTHWQPLPGVPS